MRIQSLSIVSPVKNVFGNIAFKAQKFNNFSDLKDVFKKNLPENQPKIRYYYLGKDGEAHETTAPFITKQTNFGDRLYIIRKGKPRAFGGFTVEKDEENDKQKTIIYKSGYPDIVEEYEDERNLKVTTYNTQNHRVQSIEEGCFKLEQYISDDTYSIDLRDKDEKGNSLQTSLAISNDTDGLSYAEILVEDENGTEQDCVIYWNYIGEIPQKLKNMDKNVLRAFYDNLKNLAIIIQSDEYGADFGTNSKFNYMLEELLYYLNKQIS